jgi:hypothetical protein
MVRILWCSWISSVTYFFVFVMMDWPRRMDEMPQNDHPSKFIHPFRKNIPSRKAVSANI